MNQLAPSAFALDLSPLYQKPVFRSSARVESHAHIAREFSDHGLSWKGEDVNTSMCKTDVLKLQVFALQYGAEVEITPRPFDDFVLVHVSLAGIADFVSDGKEIRLHPGEVAVLAPRHSFRMHWQRGSRQLILKIPHAAGLGADRVSELRAATALSPGDAQRYKSLVQTLLQSASAAQSGDDADLDWLRHLEQSVSAFVGAKGAGSLDALPLEARPLDATRTDALDRRRLDALRDHMQARLATPASLEELARAVGVSTRTLNALCLRHHGDSPMAVFRNLRLDAASRLLAERPGRSVTEVAFDCGFSHLGRFAAYFERRFGYLPGRFPRAMQ
jgi:AraC-like DNA-binding protein